MPDFLYNWHIAVLDFWRANPILFWGGVGGAICIFIAASIIDRKK